jgi:hypothetical protein
MENQRISVMYTKKILSFKEFTNSHVLINFRIRFISNKGIIRKLSKMYRI